MYNFRSNPGTPTQPRRPDFIGVNTTNTNQPGQVYYDFPMQHQQSLPPHQQQTQQQQQQSQQQQPQQQQLPLNHLNGGIRMSQQQSYVSPQRRFLSEGELVRQGSELSYAKSNNTVDNIRELAGSPQRGVYMWKDTSPGYSNNQTPGPPGVFITNHQDRNNINASAAATRQHSQNQQLLMSQPDYNNQQFDILHHRSNPTSPTQQMQYSASAVNVSNRYVPQNQQQQQQPPLQNNVTGGAYHPALRGGVPVFPPQPSPQLKRKATPTRPMSFVRALEITDSIEMTNSNNVGGVGSSSNSSNDQNQTRGSTSGGGGGGNPTVYSNANAVVGSQQRSTTPTPDRASVYDMNYEISV